MRPNDVYGTVLRRWAAAAALAVLWLIAPAATIAREHGADVDLQWATQGSTAKGSNFSGTATGRSYGAKAGGPTVGGQKPLPWPGKSQAQHMATWKAMATPGNIAKSMMNPASGAITLLGGMLMKQLVDEACLRVFGGVLKPGAVWDECTFSQQQIPMYRVALGGPFTRSSSRQGACSYWAAMLEPGAIGNLTSNGTFCQVFRGNGTYINGGGVQTDGFELTQVQDGWKPASDERVEDLLEGKLDGWCQADFTAGLQAGKCAQTLEELHQAGGTVELAEPEVSGPASYPQNDTKATSSTPEGGTKTVTTTTERKCTYSGSTATCTEKTATTTKTENPGQDPVEKTDIEEKKDDRARCEADPKALGCSGELDVPEGKVPTQTRDVTYAPEALGLGNGSCPPPIQWTDSLGSHAIELAPLCDKISTVIKPLVLLVAAIMGIFIIAPVSGRD